MYSKERGDRRGLNKDCKQLLEAKTKIKKNLDSSLLQHVQDKQAQLKLVEGNYNKAKLKSPVQYATMFESRKDL